MLAFPQKQRKRKGTGQTFFMLRRRSPSENEGKERQGNAKEINLQERETVEGESGFSMPEPHSLRTRGFRENSYKAYQRWGRGYHSICTRAFAIGGERDRKGALVNTFRKKEGWERCGLKGISRAKRESLKEREREGVLMDVRNLVTLRDKM